MLFHLDLVVYFIIQLTWRIVRVFVVIFPYDFGAFGEDFSCFSLYEFIGVITVGLFMGRSYKY